MPDSVGDSFRKEFLIRVIYYYHPNLKTHKKQAFSAREVWLLFLKPDSIEPDNLLAIFWLSSLSRKAPPAHIFFFPGQFFIANGK